MVTETEALANSLEKRDFPFPLISWERGKVWGAFLHKWGCSRQNPVWDLVHVITNEELLAETEREEVGTTIKLRKWKWLSHTSRKERENTARMANGTVRRKENREDQSSRGEGLSWESWKTSKEFRTTLINGQQQCPVEGSGGDPVPLEGQRGLRGLLCGKWKLFTPLDILHTVRYSARNGQQCSLLRLQLHYCHGNSNYLLVSTNPIFCLNLSQNVQNLNHRFSSP